MKCWSQNLVRSRSRADFNFLPSDRRMELYTTHFLMPTQGRLPFFLDTCSEMVIGWLPMFSTKQSLYHCPVERVPDSTTPSPLLLVTSLTCSTVATPHDWVLPEEGESLLWYQSCGPPSVSPSLFPQKLSSQRHKTDHCWDAVFQESLMFLHILWAGTSS